MRRQLAVFVPLPLHLIDNLTVKLISSEDMSRQKKKQCLIVLSKELLSFGLQYASKLCSVLCFAKKFCIFLMHENKHQEINQEKTHEKPNWITFKKFFLWKKLRI